MPVTALGSHLTEDHREIHKDESSFTVPRGIRFLIHPLQLGLLLSVLGDSCLLKEFVSQIPILVIEQGAVAHEYKVRHDSGLAVAPKLVSDLWANASLGQGLPAPRRRATGSELWSHWCPCQGGRRMAGPGAVSLLQGHCCRALLGPCPAWAVACRHRCRFLSTETSGIYCFLFTKQYNAFG